MTDDHGRNKSEEIMLSEILRPLALRGNQIRKGTVLATLIVALLAGVYLFIQPATRSMTLGFRPVFEGASTGKYPNGLPFAANDVVSTSVLEQVSARNQIDQYCPRDAFSSGFTVQENSPALQFLNLEYQARLSDVRLTPVDRQRLQDEYASRRAAIQPQYQLSYVQPSACNSVPRAIARKSISEVLETWAIESDEKRGVMKFRVPILTPRVFDQIVGGEESLLIRADLLRTAVSRVIANIEQVERLPGSELVRGSEGDTSFAEVRAELEDLRQARLDPLIVNAASAVGPGSIAFVRQALESAQIRHRAANKRADAYRQALREYSGVVPVSNDELSKGDPRESSSDVQALTPQIDRTFVDRIVELSNVNTTFRQEVTRDSLDAAIEAVERGAVVEQYQQLLTTLGNGARDQSAIAGVTKAIEGIVNDAKAATRRFNQIYAEYTRVSLRPGPAMYRIDQPVTESVVRAFGTREYGLLLLAVLVTTPILLAVTYLVHHHLHKFIMSLRRPIIDSGV